MAFGGRRWSGRTMQGKAREETDPTAGAKVAAQRIKRAGKSRGMGDGASETGPGANP